MPQELELIAKAAPGATILRPKGRRRGHLASRPKGRAQRGQLVSRPKAAPGAATLFHDHCIVLASTQPLPNFSYCSFFFRTRVCTLCNSGMEAPVSIAILLSSL
jgi:hypothetical protein